MSGYATYVRLHDHWMIDGDLVTLMVDGRHDAVCLFFAAIAYAHAHDTDGYLSDADVVAITRVVVARDDAWESINSLGKVVRAPGNSPRKRWKINAYDKWQTTREQREDDAAVKRTRARTARPRPELEKKTKKDVCADSAHTSGEHAAVVSSHSDDDGPFATVQLDELTAEVIARHPAGRFNDPYTDTERTIGLTNVRDILTKIKRA